MAIAPPRLEKNRHGVYSLRLVVPQAHRQPGDGREIRISLRTRDPVHARILALGLNTRIEKLRLERPDVDPRLVLIEHQLFASDESAPNLSSYATPSHAKSHRMRGVGYAPAAGESNVSGGFGNETIGVKESGSATVRRVASDDEADAGEASGSETFGGEEVATDATDATASEAFGAESFLNEELRGEPSATEASAAKTGAATAYVPAETKRPKPPSLTKLTSAIESFLRSRSALASNRRNTVIEKQTSLALLGKFLRNRGFAAEPPLPVRGELHGERRGPAGATETAHGPRADVPPRLRAPGKGGRDRAGAHPLRRSCAVHHRVDVRLA